MAITAATTLENLKGFIKPDLAEPYFAAARRASVVQQLARQVPLGINGIEVPIVTSKTKARWVAEGGKKQTTEMGMGVKAMKPQKLAAIAVTSAEVIRANPAGFMELLKDDLGEAFATAFDQAVLFGTESPFGSDQHLAATSKSVALGTAQQNKGGLYADVNSALKILSVARKKLTGFAFDETVEADFNSAVDANGRPLFIETPLEDAAAPFRAGKLLGRPAFVGEGVGNTEIAGFAGDWSKIIWGTTGGITYDATDQATVTINNELVSLWEHNLVAIRAEAEFGFMNADKDAFVKFTGGREL